MSKKVLSLKVVYSITTRSTVNFTKIANRVTYFFTFFWNTLYHTFHCVGILKQLVNILKVVIKIVANLITLAVTKYTLCLRKKNN